MQRLADSHAPEFLEIAVTMPQAKLLYLLGAAGELHMSDLVHRLGVSLSTISGLVDRVVDQGLAARREDPIDRRQVMVGLTPAGRDFIDRFRELNARQMRGLLDLLGDDDLASVRDALAALATAAAHLADHRGIRVPAAHRHAAKGSRMSRLSEFAVSKRSVVLLLAGALFIAGILAWGNLKQELLPDIEFPVITVIAPLPGAGANDVADQVTKPIERAISGVPNLKSLQSTSANSLSLVVAQFAFGSDVKEIRAAIEANLQNAGLPQTVTPQVTALDINSSPVIIASIAATSQGGLAAAADITQNAIKPALLGIDGVGSVDVTGGEVQRIQITLDPVKMAANGVSLAQVTGVLAANNLTFPSGQITTEGSRIPVSTIGRIGSVDEITGMVVGVRMPAGAPGAGTGQPAASGQPAPSQPAPSGQPAATQLPAASTVPNAPAAPAAPPAPTPVTIGDLGTVEIVGMATTGYARTDGKPALSLSVSKTSNANTVEVADAVTAKLNELGAQYQDTVSVQVVNDLSGFIKESRDGLLREGGLGAVFAILTIFLFLFSLRSTLVAAVSIPLSILTALVIMQATGVTLNVMTLGGLAVAVGRVVDDAIVVLENIYRHRALGEDRRTASINGPGRSPAPSPRRPSRPSACSCRSASSAGSSPSSSCPSPSRSPSRCSPRWCAR